MYDWESNFNLRHSDANEEIPTVIEASDLVCELKILMKDFYEGTITDDGKALKLRFANGQKFKITVTEIK